MTKSTIRHIGAQKEILSKRQKEFNRLTKKIEQLEKSLLEFRDGKDELLNRINKEMNTVGTIGVLLLFVKIILYAFYQTDKGFSFSTPQNPQRFLLFLPVFKDRFSQYKVFRLIVNYCTGYLFFL